MKRTSISYFVGRAGFGALVMVVGCAGGALPDDVIVSEAAAFKAEVVADGLQHPWGMVRLPDGRYLVTERPGPLRVIEGGRLLPEPVQGTPDVWARGQGGMLDIELHPDFERNGWIYLAFSDPRGDRSNTKIVRGRLDGMRWVDEETIFEAPDEQYTERAVHFGCRMQFDGKGYLFFSIGDRGSRPDEANFAQDLSVVMGKIHRVRDDGSVPDDNPFVGESGAYPTIWALGTRNAQGMKFEPGTGRLWETEHGPRGGDELNIIERGRNYGWPKVTYGINYSGTVISEKTEAPGMTPPVIEWTPSIAVAGMAFYEGDAFPEWKGDLFVTALAHQKLVRVRLDGDRVASQEILLEGTGRMRDVRCFGDGALYIVYDDPGRVVRLVPADG